VAAYSSSGGSGNAVEFVVPDNLFAGGCVAEGGGSTAGDGEGAGGGEVDGGEIVG